MADEPGKLAPHPDRGSAFFGWRRPARWRSTSLRFVLLHLTLSLFSVVPVLLYVYHEVDRILISDFERPLEFRLSNLEKHYREGGMAELVESVESRALRADRDETAILLVDPDRRALAGNVRAWPVGALTSHDWEPVTLQRDGAERGEQFLAITRCLDSGHCLLLGGLLDSRTDMQIALLRALAVAFALAFPVGLLGSVTIVRQMNRMVEAISTVGEQVAAGDLNRRAPVDGSGDPVDRLKMSLNATLDRIRDLVEEHRTLTDALAHDLRSPLTRVHIQISQGRDAPSSAAEQARLERIGQEVDTVLEMLDGALEISRAEAGIGRGDFEAFDAGAMLEDLCDVYRPLAESLDVRLEVECGSALLTHGNRSLIARAMANLIDNAFKYGATGGEIAIDARSDGGNVRLSVADHAEGIPAERRAEAIRKFGRLDAARQGFGSGLGLALVNAVASLHGGSFALEDNRPGLRAILVLPRLGKSISTDTSEINR